MSWFGWFVVIVFVVLLFVPVKNRGESSSAQSDASTDGSDEADLISNCITDKMFIDNPFHDDV